VVSLEFGCFRAREIIRQIQQQDETTLARSSQLASLVPSGANYAYDLIVYVGMESYLHGRSLQDVRQQLLDRRPALDIPPTTLWEQRQKFLFYLGLLHQQAAPKLRAYLDHHRPVTLLLDGTTEPGTSVFLGLQHAATGMLLSSWKIPSENLDDIRRCLVQTATLYGRPDDILHDLSPTMSGACDEAFEGEVSHRVCHYHLARDVGEDLCTKPQNALTKRLRALKLQFRLREQRRGQTEWLRGELESPAGLVLADLLAGHPLTVSFHGTLGREVLLAFHFWILDYRSDGRRRGFPFDPYVLYLHRRLVRAGEAMDRLLKRADVARQAPQVLFNFQQQLTHYRQDAQIVAAAEWHERAFAMFNRLREALRLSAEDIQGLHQPLELSSAEQPEIKSALQQLRSELRRQSQDQSDTDRELAGVVLAHLDKYWEYLLLDGSPDTDRPWERTTNKLESQWGRRKRARRVTHGRGKLTRDFQALPEEYMLVGNLENPTYAEIVLGGSLETLPARFAEAAHEAGSFDRWLRRRKTRILGQLPRRLLRQENLIDQLIEVCNDHCRAAHKAA
jgi:hypothetical protein